MSGENIHFSLDYTRCHTGFARMLTHTRCILFTRQSVVGRNTGGRVICACLPEGTGLALAASRHTSSSPVSCCFKCRCGEAEKGGEIGLRSEWDARGGVRIRCGSFPILLVLSYCGLVIVQRNRGFGICVTAGRFCRIMRCGIEGRRGTYLLLCSTDW